MKPTAAGIVVQWHFQYNSVNTVCDIGVEFREIISRIISHEKSKTWIAVVTVF